MLIVTTQNKVLPPLFRYMGDRVAHLLASVDSKELEEVRFRCEKPIMLYYGEKALFLSQTGGTTSDVVDSYRATKLDIEEAVEKLCHGSVYAYQNEMREGYLTTKEGERVGLCGSVVMQKNEVVNLKDIMGLNFRFAREIIGAADALISQVMAEKTLRSALLLSAPQGGKTTMLRDAARQIGDRYKTVIIDERCEIAGMGGGKSPYDLGLQTEVISACPKSIGMRMALRALSPHILITDELGTPQDVEAVRQVMNCGVAILASMHAQSAAELAKKHGMSELMSLFDTILLLKVKDGKRVLEAVKTNDL